MTTDTNRAESEAQAQLHSIVEMVKALHDAQDTKNDDAIDEARQAILEDPLSVEIRSGWTSPGQPFEPVEYQVLLCTEGPVVRITGALGQYDDPDTADLQYQEWFTPWASYPTRDLENAALLAYAREFYYES